MEGRRSLAALLRQFRLRAGLTHEALAERSGVSVRAISDLERGVSHTPRRSTLDLLGDALRLTLEERALLSTARASAGYPSAVAAPGPGSLPVQLTRFIGRQREVAEVRAFLTRDDIRLLTVTGPGGVGKTRLAIEVAAGLPDAFADGVRYVPLAGVSDSAGAVGAILRALDTPNAGRTSPGAFVEVLANMECLLFLDNFEHLLEVARLVTDVLRGCPHVKVLVTSRAALRLSGEQEYPLAPLPTPVPGRLPGLEALATNPAVAMFVDRARRVRPDVALTPENAGAIASICVRLDGLPLALELAAARTRLLPPPALLARLDESTGYGMLDMLADGARDLPARQQTLRDTIAWSYDLLDDGEQHLFRRLAVFAGGCAVDAAIAICAPDDDARSSASILLDQLTSLVDKSLVYQELGPDGEPRCLLLETIRAFALERLIASGEEPELRRRHARYYLAVVEQVGGLLFANRDNRLRTAAEQDNLHAALHWLVLHG